MKLLGLFSIVLLLVGCLSSAWPLDKPIHRNKLPHKVVCYWGTWSYYRWGVNGQYEAEDINPHLCTHINYGFAKLEGNRIALFDPDLDIGDEDWNSGLVWGHGMIRRANELRKYNPNLSVMIAIGGWNEGSDKYSQMASTAAGRREFVQSVMDFLKEYEFDGLDLDWEYPAMTAVGEADRLPGRDADKADFTELIRELHEAFQPLGYILTAAVSAGKPTIDRAYDVPAVNKYLDFINLMTYDFHGGWENATGHNAPLHPLPGATGLDQQFTVSYAVDYWIEKGADPAKLVLGMPVYGRTFTLASPGENNIGASAFGRGGNAGPLTQIVGMLGYNEICSMVKQGWDVHWNAQQHIPYATHANQWIGYDNIQSIKDKVSYLLEKRLGGGMIWSLDTDDFTGHCGDGKYPLLKAISKALIGVDGPDVKIERTHAPTKKPDWTNPETPVQTQAPVVVQPETSAPQVDPVNPPHHHHQGGSSFQCTSEGFFKDPVDAFSFHQCVSMSGKLTDYVFNCPPGTKYDDKVYLCL